MELNAEYTIVGAGPSGLTVAYELLKAGKTVSLIERDERIGGLAKSYNYSGQIFDTGPKRFHTDDSLVLGFLDEIAKEDLLRIGRSTLVYFLDRYYEWPLNTSQLGRMPVGVSINSFFDMLRRRPPADKNSFPDYILSKYGKTLYSLFFQPYTEKFLRRPASEIHADWANTGINRSVVDDRVDADSLFDLLKSLALPKKVDTEFLYPSSGGFGGFYEKLFGLCQGFEGFTCLLGDQISSVEKSSGNLLLQTNSGSTLSCDQLIWSGNLNDLCGIIDSEQRRVEYLNTVFYNLICKEEAVGKNRAQWIYMSKGQSLISRITCMREFADYTCNHGYYNFICELTDSQITPKYFKEPTAHSDEILKELVDMSFLKGASDVESIEINRVQDTYPIYHRNYIRDFARAKQIVQKYSRRIHLLGRAGAFWYNNSDHSIRFGLETAWKLLGRRKSEFEYRNYFG